MPTTTRHTYKVSNKLVNKGENLAAKELNSVGKKSVVHFEITS